MEGEGPEEEVEDVSQVTEAEKVRDECAGLEKRPERNLSSVNERPALRWRPKPNPRPTRRRSPTRTKKRTKSPSGCDSKPSAKTAPWSASRTPPTSGGTFRKRWVRPTTARSVFPLLLSTVYITLFCFFFFFLELTEAAKADLLEFEEKERLRKQGRYGGRGRGGGGVMGGRGRGPSAFGMGGFRKDCGGGPGRGMMNEPRPPLMPVNLGVQVNTHRTRGNNPPRDTPS